MALSFVYPYNQLLINMKIEAIEQIIHSPHFQQLLVWYACNYRLDGPTLDLKLGEKTAQNCPLTATSTHRPSRNRRDSQLPQV